jgi:hypothetical protein
LLSCGMCLAPREPVVVLGAQALGDGSSLVVVVENVVLDGCGLSESLDGAGPKLAN